MPERGWNPTVYFWDGGWIGVAASRGIVPPHAHHAVQVTLALDGRRVRFREPDADWSEGAGAVIAPNAPHSFEAMESLVAMIFIDPESREGRWLRHSLRGPITFVDASRYEKQRDGLLAFSTRRPSVDEASDTIREVARALCEGPPPLRTMDKRIGRALAYLRSCDPRGLTQEDVARQVFLSPSRFGHLFTEEVGLPFRRYLLWRKLNRAMDAFGRGANLSTAAHAAGFSDSAHLTRTFNQMFGIPPTIMIGGAEFHEIPPPFELALPAPLSPN